MDEIIMLELYGALETCALINAIDERLAALANGYTRNDVIEFLALGQISMRITPQIEVLAGQERLSDEYERKEKQQCQIL